MHKSDCQLHNGPAFPAEICDCGVLYDKLQQVLRDTFVDGVAAERLGRAVQPFADERVMLHMDELLPVVSAAAVELRGAE